MAGTAVVVVTYNSEDVIGACLDALAKYARRRTCWLSITLQPMALSWWRVGAARESLRTPKTGDLQARSMRDFAKPPIHAC